MTITQKAHLARTQGEANLPLEANLADGIDADEKNSPWKFEKKYSNIIIMQK